MVMVELNPLVIQRNIEDGYTSRNNKNRNLIVFNSWIMVAGINVKFRSRHED